MSGLVNGLQNRLRRFESARHLRSKIKGIFLVSKESQNGLSFYFKHNTNIIHYLLKNNTLSAYILPLTIHLVSLSMINKYPQVTFVYDRRKIASQQRKATVDLRITYNSKQKFISTGIMLYPNQWKKGIITNCPDAIQDRGER